MNNEKDAINMDAEQTHQFFTVAVEQAVTKAVEQIVSPKLDEHNLRLEEQNRKIDKLRIDMRIAIRESNADRLKGAVTISSLITILGCTIVIEVCSILVSLLK